MYCASRRVRAQAAILPTVRSMLPSTQNTNAAIVSGGARVDADAGLEQIAHAAGDHTAGRERLAAVIELADDRAERLRR